MGREWKRCPAGHADAPRRPLRGRPGLHSWCRRRCRGLGQLVRASDLQLEDRTGIGHDKAGSRRRNQLLGLAAKDPILAGVRPNNEPDTPQAAPRPSTQAKAERARAQPGPDQTTTFGRPAWGGELINNFVESGGRLKRVFRAGRCAIPLQARGHRQLVMWRGATGTMTPFSAFAAFALDVGTGAVGPLQRPGRRLEIQG